MNGSASYRQLLAVPDVAALLAATCLSRLAGRMFALAIVLYALARFDSPVVAGWLAFASVAPGLLISPIAGALLDRVGPAWAIGMDMAASAVLVMGLTMADRLGWTSVPMMLVMVMLFSLTSPLSTAGIRTLLPRLVPMDALDRANALDTAIHGLVDVCGPALAGVLVGFAGSTSALIVISLIYGFAALAVGFIRRPPLRPPRTARLLRQAAEGIVQVARQPTLRGLAVAYSFYQVTWGILVVAVPVQAGRMFEASDAGVVAGLLWTCSGVAGGLGALVAGRLRTARRERLVVACGMLLTALATWPIAGELGLAGLVTGLILIGAVAGPVDVGVLTLRQRRTDPALLGRVLAVSISVNLAGIPIGTAMAGMILPWSVSATFVIAGMASGVAAIAAMLLIPD